MDPRFVASSKVLFEQGWNGAVGAREYTASELDAIADFGWTWGGLQRAVVAGVQTLQGFGFSLGGRWHVSIAPLQSPHASEL